VGLNRNWKTCVFRAISNLSDWLLTFLSNFYFSRLLPSGSSVSEGPDPCRHWDGSHNCMRSETFAPLCMFPASSIQATILVMMISADFGGFFSFRKINNFSFCFRGYSSPKVPEWFRFCLPFFNLHQTSWHRSGFLTNPESGVKGINHTRKLPFIPFLFAIFLPT